MKAISLWAIAIVSALFVVVICVDSHNWKLLGGYTAILAVWMLIGWFWHHRFDLYHDLHQLSRAESPFMCRWIGTFVLCALMFLFALTLIVGGLTFIVSQGLKFL